MLHVFLFTLFVSLRATQYQLGSFQVTVDQDTITIVNPSLKAFPLFSAQLASLIAASKFNIPTPIINGEYNELLELIAPSYKTNKLTITKTTYNKDSNLILNGQVTSSSNSRLVYDFTFLLRNDNAATSQLFFDIQLTPGISNPEAVNTMHFCYDSPTNEGIFGLGNQYSYFNQKGLRIPIIISEQGIGRGLQPLSDILNSFGQGAGGNFHTTYGASPVYISTMNRALLLTNKEVSIFDFKQSTTTACIELWGMHMNGRLISGGTPLQLIQEITTYTGRMQPLPDWILNGVVVGMEGGTNTVLNYTRFLYDNGVPLAGIWLQDWVGTQTHGGSERLVWNWELNTAHYPNWNGMLSYLSSHNTRVMIYVNSFFEPITNMTGFRHNYFKEGDANGYFVKNSSGHTYLLQSGAIPFAMVDFTNPNAKLWMKNIIKTNMLQIANASGWMADFAEYLPFDAKLYNSAITAPEYHNLYAQDWAVVNHEALSEANALGKVVPFHRSSWTQSPKYVPVFWAGDQLVTWDEYDGIKTVLYSAFSKGISGHQLTHSDVGGFTMINEKLVPIKYERSAELLMRWIELETWCGAMFRSHPGLSPASSAQVWSSVAIAKQLAKFGKIYASLATYKKSMMAISAKLGYPLVRPLYLNYPNDKTVVQQSLSRTRAMNTVLSQFMVGTDILVAPILDQGRTQRQVYLPQGHWKHMWSTTVYNSAGQTVNIDAPIGQPPVFVKQQAFDSDVFAELRRVVASM